MTRAVKTSKAIGENARFVACFAKNVGLLKDLGCQPIDEWVKESEKKIYDKLSEYIHTTGQLPLDYDPFKDSKFHSLDDLSWLETLVIRFEDNDNEIADRKKFAPIDSKIYNSLVNTAPKEIVDKVMANYKPSKNPWTKVVERVKKLSPLEIEYLQVAFLSLSGSYTYSSTIGTTPLLYDKALKIAKKLFA